MTWFQLANAIILELDPLPGGAALELHVFDRRGTTYAAWLLDDGRTVMVWRAAQA